MRSGARTMTAIFAATLIATIASAAGAWADPPPQPPEAAPAPAAALLPAASHDGDALIAILQSFCITAHGDPAAAMAKADAAGWTQADADLVKSVDSPELHHPSVRFHEDAAGKFILASGTSAITVDGAPLTMHMCMVMKQGGDNDELVVAVTRWMGPTFGDAADSRLWLYSMGGKKGADPNSMSNADALAAARAGGVEMIQVQKQSKSATVVYSILDDRPG